MHGQRHFSQVRDWLTALDAVLASWVDQVPPSTSDYVRACARLPYLPALRREWAMLKGYRQA